MQLRQIKTVIIKFLQRIISLDLIVKLIVAKLNDKNILIHGQ